MLARVLLGIAAIALPIGAWIAILGRGDRQPSSPRTVAATLLFGAVAFGPAWFLEGLLTGLTGLRVQAGAKLDIAGLIFAFLVAAPLEQALKVLAAGPAWRLREGRHRPFDGLTYATASAIGFVTAHNVVFLVSRGPAPVEALRALLGAIAHPCLAASWGWALGREPHKRMGGQVFVATWAAATMLNGVCDQLVFTQGLVGMLVASPVIAGAAVVTWLQGRHLLRRERSGAHVAPVRAPRTGPRPPTSLRAMREALRRSERPVSLGWILLGTLVTTGVITAMLAGAVILGHRLGVDFAVVDRDASQPAAAAPLILLGSGALLAFPIAGWVVARASAARSLLEAAIASGMSIMGSLVLLGMAAPVAVVFALAFAPVAFGLSCLGAWLGMERG